MEAIVKKIELKKILSKYYLKITMESEKKEYILSNPLLNDPINFRKQVFGILSACNCYDLMKLGRDNPIPKPAIGYYLQGRGYKIFENEKGEWFTFYEKTGRYSCRKADEATKKLIKMAQQNKISAVSIEKGTIEKIISESGTFQILFKREQGGGSFHLAGQIYYGFGHPIHIGDNACESEKIDSAQTFTSYIVNLMKFCREEDMLKLGGEVERYPKVEIMLDHSNKIKTITNAVTGLGLGIERNYEIVDFSKNQGKERAN